jgi:glutamate synthase (NADPH/NADH) large chain
MTAGTVVVLGPVGRNFAAGMSGGLAFVWDPDKRLDQRYNSEMVTLKSVEASESEALRALLTRHHEATKSPHAAALLADWAQAIKAFRRVTPIGSTLTLNEAATVKA